MRTYWMRAERYINYLQLILDYPIIQIFVTLQGIERDQW